MRTETPYIIAYAIGLLLAIGFGYGAWALVQDQQRMGAVGELSDGIVTGHVIVKNYGRHGSVMSTTYRPMVRYRTMEGLQVEAAAATPLELGEIKVGAVMRVIYDPANPTDVRLARAIEDGPGGTPWLLGGVALALGAPCAAGLLKRLRGRPAQSARRD